MAPGCFSQIVCLLVLAAIGLGVGVQLAEDAATPVAAPAAVRVLPAMVGFAATATAGQEDARAGR